MHCKQVELNSKLIFWIIPKDYGRHFAIQLTGGQQDKPLLIHFDPNIPNKINKQAEKLGDWLLPNAAGNVKTVAVYARNTSGIFLDQI